MGIKVLDRDSIEGKCQELAALITRHTEGKGNGFHQTAIEELAFQRESSPSAPLYPAQGLCTPIFAILVQGKKKVGEQNEAVRQIATSGSNMQRIAQAIQLIKVDFTQTVRIDDLAEQARMSPSSFYHHFKQVTSMSPIQYQKQLRLLEARRLMLAENSNATSAADRVGYESQSQFSREYARMFGAPPRRDIDRLRMG
jgi:AraC-like DNA-binding protein